MALRLFFILLLGLLLAAPLAQAITVNIAWDYTDSGQDGFQLKRCTGSSCTPSTDIGSVLASSARQATDTTVAGGTSYCYGVTATGTVDSALSNTLCVSIPTPGTATHLTFTTPPQASTITNQTMNTLVVAVKDGFEATVTSGGGATASITVALVPPSPAAIPAAQTSLVSVDSEELVVEFSPGVQAINGDGGNTWWHTQYGNGTTTPLPHTIIVNLGATYNVTGFKYLPRQDIAPTTASGTIAGYQFSVSADGTNWGTLAASGTFANTVTEKTVTFAGRTGRYIRLVATSEVYGDQWTSIAELTTIQTGTGGGTLQGTAAGTASAGLLSFPGLSITQAGSYVLQATSSGLISTTAPLTIVDSPIPVHVPYVIRVGH